MFYLVTGLFLSVIIVTFAVLKFGPSPQGRAPEAPPCPADDACEDVVTEPSAKVDYPPLRLVDAVPSPVNDDEPKPPRAA